MKIKNILITGGLGFIGNNLAKNLIKKNKNVTILDNSYRGNIRNISNIKHKIRVIKCDLLKKKTSKKHLIILILLFIVRQLMGLKIIIIIHL